MSYRTEIIEENRGKETPAQRNAHGKKFERYLQEDCFGPLNNLHPIKWRRIIDAAAAGSTFVGGAEGDFSLVMKSETKGQPYNVLIECKASSIHESLSQCFRSIIDKDQLAKARIHERAGGVAIYMFHSVRTGMIEIWPCQPIASIFHQKRVPLLDYIVEDIAYANMPNIAKDIVTRPGPFISSILAKETRT